MSGTGDHVPEMPTIPLLDDLAIEAILGGDDVPAGLGRLAAFAAGVRAVGDGPAPRPSPELANLLETGSAAMATAAGATTLDQRRNQRAALAKVAGLGLVAKVSLAATTAAAGVIGAGAAGVLPGGAGRVVRDAIEVVTPVEFTDPDDQRQPDGGGGGGGGGGGQIAPDASPSDAGDHGDRVSDDATGESDGEPGVDGSEISREAPGASQRPPETPGPEGTPEPPADPGTPPVSVPQGEPGNPADPGSPPPAPGSTVPSPPSTVPTPPSPVPLAAARVDGARAGQPSHHPGAAGRRRHHRRHSRALMPPRNVATRGPAHLSRTRHPTPWTRQATRRLDRPAPERPPVPAPTPVFVDDSGRRRRAGRLLGIGLGALVLAYVTVVGLTFAGAPVVGRLAPPGVAQLSRPTGDDGPGVVGPDAREAALPPAGASPDPASAPGDTPSAGLDAGGPIEQPGSTTTTAPPTTTTSAPPGQGATTTVPTPSSTVPDRTHPTAGPPTEPPGKP